MWREELYLRAQLNLRNLTDISTGMEGPDVSLEEQCHASMTCTAPVIAAASVRVSGFCCYGCSVCYQCYQCIINVFLIGAVL